MAAVNGQHESKRVVLPFGDLLQVCEEKNVAILPLLNGLTGIISDSAVSFLILQARR